MGLPRHKKMKPNLTNHEGGSHDSRDLNCFAQTEILIDDPPLTTLIIAIKVKECALQ